MSSLAPSRQLPNTPDGGGVFDDFPVDRKSCQLLGPTALIVQGLMGVLVIASLVFKRHREKPKRLWRIWLFDVSKQVVGQLFVHGVNLFISDVGSARSSGNACVFYFLNILIDTTLGVGAIYLTLYILTWFLTEKLHFMGLQSGQYGTPPALSYWARQAAVYVVSLTSMKLIVIVVLASWRGLLDIGAWLLSWLGNGNTAQVIFTMGFFPILMNVIQFWLIDSIVKAGGLAGISLSSDSLDHADREPLFQSGNEATNDVGNDDDDDGEDGSVFVSARKRDIEASGQAQRFRRSNDSTHTYPPSVSGSPATVPRTSISPPPVSGSVLSTRSRHSTPAQHPTRSPRVTTLDRPGTSLEMVAEASGRSKEDWRPWDSDHDWADRVGEEDRTGQPASARLLVSDSSARANHERYPSTY